MRFTGRSRELGRLRRVLDGRRPGVMLVHGVRGGGKSTLVERVAVDYRAIVHRCPPLPDPAQRAALAHHLAAECRAAGVEESRAPAPDADWTELFACLPRLAARHGQPLVLVLDDAHRLAEARSRYARAIASIREAMTGADSNVRPPVVVHFVLVGPIGGLPEVRTLEPGTTSEGSSVLDEVESLEVGPLPLRTAAPFLPGSNAVDQVRAYGVFGGIPEVLRTLDRTVGLGTNIRRVLLEQQGALLDATAWLERDVQTPARYHSILSTLSFGDADWSTVHAGVPDLTSSGQLAPYLKRLGELGLVSTRSSLDASPRSRARRYGVADPFFAFWYRFVFPFRFGAPTGRGGAADYFARAVRPEMDRHMEWVFARVCRQHMEYDALGTFGAAARESGALWGPEHEIPVAALLTSGAACYGDCSWRSPTRDDSPLARLDRTVAGTRYGYGRERRQRLIFTGEPAPAWLRREVARRQDATLIDAEALIG